MGILGGNPKEQPMHYGEVSTIWAYLLGAKGAIAKNELFINHCGDQDLKQLLEDKINTINRPEVKQLEELLKANGIELPPAPPEKPSANLEQIQAGARFQDPEIAQALTMSIAQKLIACSQVMGQATREDIAIMFGQFHMNVAQFGLRLLRLQKEKGWLVHPPLHVQTPEPVTV